MGPLPPFPRVGVVTPWLASDSYARAVVSGIAAGVRERQGSIICFALGWGDPSFYDLLGAENVEGIIILSGSFVQAEGADVLTRLCERLRPLPLVSVGIAMPGTASITVDDATGVREATHHLVRSHGMRRIAFVRGPENSVDANARYRAYREALAELGLKFDPRIVVSGDFSAESGRGAVEQLLRGQVPRPQAIVTADDSIALGALAALIERGISVPGEMAVIGFDDAEEAVPSALTTINQRLRDQGKHAARLLWSQLLGAASEEHLLLPTALVIRRSCGCFPFAATSLVDRVNWSETSGVRQAIEGHHARIVEVMQSACLAGTDWHAHLLSAFLDDLEGEEGYPFLSALDRALNHSASRRIELSDWDEVVLALGRTVLPLLTNSATRYRADILLEKGLLLVEEATKREQAFQHLYTRTRSETLNSISQALMFTSDLDGLATALEDGLVPLGVRGCHISLYESPTSRTERARLVLSFDGRHCRVLPPDEPSFPTRVLTPPHVLPSDRRYETVVTPLSSDKSHSGLIVFEIDPAAATIYEDLRWQLGATFSRMAAQQELARMHADEADRRAELEEAYAALKENQNRLLISEKMASLGRLTAGIAHEMNTPLATVRASLEELRNLAREYAAVAEGALAEQQVAIAKDMAEAILVASRAAARAAEFVRGIKFQTRDLASSDFHAFEPVPVVDETLLLLGHLLRGSNCTVHFEPPARIPRLYGAPTLLSQVLTNLMTNAIDASRPKGGGPIRLDLTSDEKDVIFTVTDSGIGIAPESISKIFDPMFTTKPFGEGTGLGLSIAHDIVTGDFNGSIEVESRVGEGTTFTVRLSALPDAWVVGTGKPR